LTDPGLENLARIGKLAAESASAPEIAGLLRSGRERLKDARNEALAFSSRFDLAYNAAHALSPAALRWQGYRSDNRYLVFQAPPHTLGVPAPVWRVLAKAHEVRNAAEYEGSLDADLALLNSLIDATEKISVAVGVLPAPGDAKSP
jgi:hypothetical protein